MATKDWTLADHAPKGMPWAQTVEAIHQARIAHARYHGESPHKNCVFCINPAVS